MSRDSPNTGSDTPVQVVSNIKLDSLISDDELVECLNRFKVPLEYKNKFKLVMNSLTGQKFGLETTQPDLKIKNDDADASDHADHLLNNPKLRNSLLSSLSVAQTGKSLSKTAYNSVMRYILAIFYMRCFQSKLVAELTLRDYLDAKSTPGYTVVSHDSCTMALTHTEWQYVAQYVRHVRPKLPTDESDPSKSRMFVLHSTGPIESVHKHVLALEKQANLPHFTIDKILDSYLLKLGNDCFNKDPRGFYLSGLIAKISQKCNLGQGFDKSIWINMLINDPAKLDLALVAGPSFSLPKTGASSECDVQMVLNDQPVEILFNKWLEIALKKIALSKEGNRPSALALREIVLLKDPHFCKLTPQGQHRALNKLALSHARAAKNVVREAEIVINFDHVPTTEEADKFISENKVWNNVKPQFVIDTYERLNKVEETEPVVEQRASRSNSPSEPMLLADHVKHQDWDGLAVKNYDGRGRGVVATIPMEPGKTILDYQGDKWVGKEAETKEVEFSKDPLFQPNYLFWDPTNKILIDAQNEDKYGETMGRLLNHTGNIKHANLAPKFVDLPGVGPSIVFKTVLKIFAGDELLYHYGDMSRDLEPWYYKCPCLECLPPSQTVDQFQAAEPEALVGDDTDVLPVVQVTEPESLVELAEGSQTVVEVDVHAIEVHATIEQAPVFAKPAPVETEAIRVKPARKYLRQPSDDSPAYTRKRTKRKAVESDHASKTAKKTRHDFDMRISPCKVKINRQVQRQFLKKFSKE